MFNEIKSSQKNRIAVTHVHQERENAYYRLICKHKQANNPLLGEKNAIPLMKKSLFPPSPQASSQYKAEEATKKKMPFGGAFFFPGHPRKEEKEV